jgi:hypothetical protein
VTGVTKLVSSPPTVTIVHGEGGFGKTTLARMACTDRCIRRRFPGDVLDLRLRGQRGRDLAQVISETIADLGEKGPYFSDVNVAGKKLGRPAPASLSWVSSWAANQCLSPWSLTSGRARAACPPTTHGA